MKHLIINLDRSPDRLAHVAAQFSHAGITFQRVAAIDGLNRPELAAMSPSLSLSEIGCFLSHRVCWDIVAKGEDAYVAIFEDDVILAETAGQLLASKSWIPEDADIVKLETVFRKAVISMKQSRASQSYSLHRLYGLHLGSGGYVISRQAASKLLEATQSNDAPIDHILFDPSAGGPSNMAIYQVTPAICAQALFLNDKDANFPSEMEMTRSAQQQKRNLAKQRSKAPSAKFVNEVRRVSRQVLNVCRLRFEKTIPFNYHGNIIRRSMAVS